MPKWRPAGLKHRLILPQSFREVRRPPKVELAPWDTRQAFERLINRPVINHGQPLAGNTVAVDDSDSGPVRQDPSHDLVRGWPPPRWMIGVALGALGVIALLLRFWALNRFGLNSDEAVCVGQAANLAGVERLADDFSIFRAHPLLFQYVLSLIFRAGEVTDVAGRYLAAVFGLLTIPITYLIGRSLFNKRVGVLSAVFVALAPLHVIVSRQAMLEAPFAFFFTLTMLALVRYRELATWPRAVAIGAAAGLTFMSKEVGILVLAVVGVILLVEGRIRWRHAALVLTTFAVAVAPHLYAVGLGGSGEGGGSWVDYVIWQVGRPPNHPASFYLANTPVYFGVPVLLLLAAGLFIAVRSVNRNMNYFFLLAWFALPAVFFQVWKVRGFHYVVPIVGAVALLAALPLDELWRKRTDLGRAAFVAIVSIAIASLIWVSATSGTFVVDYARVGDAGYSGIPGGRETALWLRDNTPEGVRVLGIGPSMGNILRFYGDIDAAALSISPNPLRANPAYEPVRNPDYLLRWGLVEYLIYDVYSADRTSHFANRLLDFIERYGGELVHEEFAFRVDKEGNQYRAPVIRVYRVAPVGSG